MGRKGCPEGSESQTLPSPHQELLAGLEQTAFAPGQGHHSGRSLLWRPSVFPAWPLDPVQGTARALWEGGNGN